MTATLGGGPVVIVTYEPPGLNRVGSLHPLTLTREDGSNVYVGVSRQHAAIPFAPRRDSAYRCACLECWFPCLSGASPGRQPVEGPAGSESPAGRAAGGRSRRGRAALVVWAYRIAPTARLQSYDPIFWAGMLLAYLAVAWRALSGRYAVFWLGLFGLFTLLPTFWTSPDGPSGFDEIAQFALLRNVISAGRLFQHTPLLPIGTYYPGLQSAAATIHWLTGLSPWDSALTLIAVVHCLLPVQVYYIARALPVPHRWAAAAGLSTPPVQVSSTLTLSSRTNPLRSCSC